MNYYYVHVLSLVELSGHGVRVSYVTVNGQKRQTFLYNLEYGICRGTIPDCFSILRVSKRATKVCLSGAHLMKKDEIQKHVEEYERTGVNPFPGTWSTI